MNYQYKVIKSKNKTKTNNFVDGNKIFMKKIYI